MTVSEVSPDHGRAGLIAQRVRGLMGEARISQAALARELSMTQQAFSRRTTGSVEFGIGEIETLARVLHVSEAYLYGFTNDRTPARQVSDGGQLYAIRDLNPEPAD